MLITYSLVLNSKYLFIVPVCICVKNGDKRGFFFFVLLVYKNYIFFIYHLLRSGDLHWVGPNDTNCIKKTKKNSENVFELISITGILLVLTN